MSAGGAETHGHHGEGGGGGNLNIGAFPSVIDGASNIFKDIFGCIVRPAWGDDSDGGGQGGHGGHHG